MSFAVSLGEVAPLYNLGLVIVVTYLFFNLFNTPIRDRRVYLLPWKLIFTSLIIFVIEELFTFLRTIGIIDIPTHINGFFELAIIGTFIYALLLQREHLKRTHIQ